LKKNKITSEVTKVVKKPPIKGKRRKYILRLFVAGATARSRQAILRVRDMCAIELKDSCDLAVIDIYQQPALARDHQIVATPTLVIEFPKPVRRFIGNLLHSPDLAVELEINEQGKISL